MINQSKMRKAMHRELDVLLNKMFHEFPTVPEFRVTVDYINDREEDDETYHISAIADSLVDENGATMDRNYLYYKTNTETKQCVADVEDFITDDIPKANTDGLKAYLQSRYYDHKAKGLCVRCDDPATKGIYCDKHHAYMSARYKKTSK